mmetsp:Transcript_8548/g.23606  ORF Transcript_8548/g.23606 Transcript_8548/m.23606 type:complete len:249 (-) Transcript_8548:68-814(-)
MDEEAITSAISKLSLSFDGEAMTYASHRRLEADRKQVVGTAFPGVAEAGSTAVAVVATKGDEVKEFIAVFKSAPDGAATAAPELPMGSCQITFEDLTPSDCIEYAFGEAPDEWSMAQLSTDALEEYRNMKFEAWKSMLLNPTCEAQFRRMLQIGMISQLYDPQVFPTPKGHQSKYQVTDERTGKKIQLPHPVKALRVWDAKTLTYKSIETQLTGAPGRDEAAQWWEDFVKDLNAKHGEEYIVGLMACK